MTALGWLLPTTEKGRRHLLLEPSTAYRSYQPVARAISRTCQQPSAASVNSRQPYLIIVVGPRRYSFAGLDRRCRRRITNDGTSLPVEL